MTDFFLFTQVPRSYLILCDQKPILVNTPAQIFLIGEVEIGRERTQDGPEDDDEDDEEEEAEELEDEDADDTDDGDMKREKGMEVCDLN